MDLTLSWKSVQIWI